MDFGSTVVCLAIAATPTSKQLYAAKVPHKLMSWVFLAPILLHGASAALTQGLAIVILNSMDWYDSKVDQVRCMLWTAYVWLYKECFLLQLPECTCL